MRIWAAPEELSNSLDADLFKKVVSISGQLDQKYNIDCTAVHSRREIERLSTQSPGSRFCFGNVGNEGPFIHYNPSSQWIFSAYCPIVKFLRNEPHVASRDATSKSLICPSR